jgi:radical SAM/Cys-rich protein
MLNKSLRSTSNPLAESKHQLELLHSLNLATFSSKLKETNLLPLTANGVDVMQINLGKMCNQVCKHCHVDAGPDRKEIMTRETMEICLEILRKYPIKSVDLTGGAPEMNPNFRWFVEEISALGKSILVRCNLTIILANKKYYDLPDFFKTHSVEIVSSLPHYTANRTDRQRGEGVFEKSIKALQLLNHVGYGMEDSGLKLNLVFNPSGALLPGSQEGLEADFKQRLYTDHGIMFNQLFTITNMPISRFLDYLVESENLEDYMDKLISAYNPVAAQNVMCKNTLSIGWDGSIYDCDFNQMLDIKINSDSDHISTFDFSNLKNRTICIDEHCFGCTAGAGSSCGGELV